IRTPYSTSCGASGNCGKAVKFRIAIPNVFDNPVIRGPSNALSNPAAVRPLRDVELVRIEVPQYRKFALARRVSRAQLLRNEQAETSIVLNFLERDSGMQGQDPHPLLLLVEAHDGEIGDDAIHPAGSQPGVATAGAAVNPAGTGDEVDFLDEAALLVLHRDDHRDQARDVVAAARAGQTRCRIVGIADERAVEIAVLVDLRSTHEADIDIAALQEEEDIGAPQHHVRAPRTALLVGRGRKLTGFDERPDRATLEEDRKTRAMQALRKR